MRNVSHRLIFEHILPSWWCCLGMLWKLQEADFLVKVCHWRCSLRFDSLATLPVLSFSLSASCVMMKCDQSAPPLLLP